MSAKGTPHCDRPASTSALPALAMDAPACFQFVVENMVFAKQLCPALMMPVAIITELLVAARGSGDRQVFCSKTKSMLLNVPLDRGSSWNRHS